MGRYFLIGMFALILSMPSCGSNQRLQYGSHYLDGSIIFLENTQPIVEWYTESSLTHCAIIFSEGQNLWVYEAWRPAVKKTPFEIWVKSVKTEFPGGKGEIKAWVSQPDYPYTENQVKAMKNYCESQLGRPYSISSFLVGPKKTIHCCELVSNAFNAAGFNYSVEPWRETPIKIWRKTGEKYVLALQP